MKEKNERGEKGKKNKGLIVFISISFAWGAQAGLWGEPKVAGLREETQEGKACEKSLHMIEKRNIVGRMRNFLTCAG